MARKRGGVRLDWKGDQIARKAERATVEATDAVNEKAAEKARSDHGWRSQTGTAERSIRAQPAEVTPQGVKGSFGSYGSDAYYFIFLEVGSANTPADDTLRRAADDAYQKLPEEIKRRI